MPRQKKYKKYFNTNDEVIIPGRTERRYAESSRESFKRNENFENFTVRTHDLANNESSENLTQIDLISDSSVSPDEEEPADFSPENSDDNGLLFNSAKISSSESASLIFAFVFRHKLTKDAAADLLNLINFHLPRDKIIAGSLHCLKKLIPNESNVVERHFYCDKCGCYLGPSPSGLCRNCQFRLSKKNLSLSRNFFLLLDARQSILHILGDPCIGRELEKTLGNRFKNASAFLTDITDGTSYRNLPLQLYDITCTLNTDGVAIFESSQFSVWPLFASINELTYKSRRKNTFLVALWFGNQKPKFEIFLEPVIRMCKLLSTEGLVWNLHDTEVKSRVFFAMFAADSVARCTIQGINQYNGEYSCPWCLANGETFWTTETSHKWIFPPSVSQKRDHSQFLAHLKAFKESLDSGEKCSSYFGIKSASKLLLLSHFNIIDGFVFDYMHTALLGVSRTFMCEWLNSKNHEECFYIGNKEKQIDEKLLQFLVPYEVNRVTRSIQHIKYWKANEWKTWTIVCKVVLKNILPDVYLNNFSKFTSALYMLCKESISKEELAVAQARMNDFCSQAALLYGNRVCSFNMHLMTHAAECVQRWGPLWAYSTFQFEHLNGILARSFKGTQNVAIQTVNRLTERINLERFAQRNMGNLDAIQFFNNILESKKSYKNSLKVGSVTLLGPTKKYIFNDSEKRLLSKIGIDLATEGQSFKKCVANNRIYNTWSRNSSKRCNSIVKANNKIFVINSIVSIGDGNVEKAVFMGVKLGTTEVGMESSVLRVNHFSTTTRIGLLEDIEKIKFIVSVNSNGELLYALPLPNAVELD